jgi:tetratricopeptide (TPR) repeat protein
MSKRFPYTIANWQPGRASVLVFVSGILLVAGGLSPLNLQAQPQYNSYKNRLSTFFLNHPEYGKPVSHYDSLSQHSPYLVDQFFGLLGGAYLMYRTDAASATTRLVQAKTLLHNKPELKAYQGYLYTIEGLLSAQVENFEAADNLYRQALDHAKTKNLTEMRWLIQNWYAASLLRAENYAGGYNLLNSTLNEVNNTNPKQTLLLEEIKLELLSNQGSVLTALSFKYPR